MKEIEKLTQYRDKFRLKNYSGMPLTIASFLLFGCRNSIQDHFRNGSFFLEEEHIEKRIYMSDQTSRCQLYIDREFFFNFWQKISNCEIIISSFNFRKILKVDANIFDAIIDKSQRVKGVRGSYYKLSYVNKVLKDNNLPLL